MKIIMLNRNYFPAPNAVGVCAKEIITAIKDLGLDCEIAVICEKNALEQIDYEIIDDVHIYRFLSLETEERLSMITSTLNMSPVQKMVHSMKSVLVKAKYYFRDVFRTVSIKPELVEGFTILLNSLPLRKGDIIVPFSAPFESVVAATEYVFRNKDIVMIPILYDLFSDCSFLHKNWFIKMIKYYANKRLEEKMIISAKRVLCCDCWIKSLSAFKETDKITVVDVPLLKISELSSSTNNELVYCGNFKRKVRETDFFCRFLYCYLKNSERKVIIRIIGNGNKDKRLMRLKKRFPQKIILDGYVPHVDAVIKMRDSKGLLIVANERKNQTPSKVFECMSMNKPIVYITKHRQETIDSVLTKYARTMIIKKNDNIEEMCFRLDNFLARSPHPMTNEELEKTFARATPAFTAKKIIDN